MMDCELKTILVYNGLGSDSESSSLLLEALQKSIKTGIYEIRYSSSDEIVEGKFSVYTTSVCFFITADVFLFIFVFYFLVFIFFFLYFFKY